MTNKNLLLATDVYKLGHMLFYPENTTKIYSYLVARSNHKYEECLFFGLQYYLKEYLSKPVTRENAEEFLEYRKSILGNNPPDVINKVFALADLGYIPLHIKAVPEGTVINNKNVLMTVTNSHPDFYWLVCFVESLLLKVWNTCTVATYSLKYKNLVKHYLEETASSNDLLPFLVHDFGYRGCSSEETAALSGAAHLINFLGTDTVPAIKLLKDYYGAVEPIGLSVPATEHSVMCAYGRDGELRALENIIDSNPSGIVSIVSDTYDFFNVISNYSKKLKDKILSRDGKVVFRPDSGDPKKIICGDPDALLGTNERLGALQILEGVFGSTTNSKGYKELNPKVGLIYGDAMYYERYADILETMRQMEFANTNLVIGVGGLLLQQHNRDDMGFSFKATYAEIDGKGIALFKDPITDQSKKSHRGLLKLIKESGKFITLDNVTQSEEKEGELQTVYLDGKTIKETTLSEIKRLSEKGI